MYYDVLQFQRWFEMHSAMQKILDFIANSKYAILN